MLVAALAVAGCGARMSRLVESIAFYAPSRALFETPAGVRDVSIQVGGRATLHGWWLEHTTDGSAKATVLFCHGNAGSLPDHLAFVENLPALGIDVLMFDYRGYGRSSPVRRLHRETLLRDANAARRAVPELAGSSDAPVVLIGHSMGAVIGLAMLAEHPDGFDGAVLVAPFASFPRVASDFAGPLGPLLIRDGLAAEDAITRVDDTPILLIHGLRDRVVRPYHADRIAEAARRAGVRLELVLPEQADHVSVFNPEHGTPDAIVRFIESLGPDD